MVKVEIVTDDNENKSPYSSAASSRTGSSSSLASSAGDVDDTLDDETLFERIAALKDIISPRTRYTISSRASATGRGLKAVGKALGNVVWIVTTSALLVGLPLALSLEDEAKVMAQEKEMMMQQQGQQQVCFAVSFFVFYLCFFVSCIVFCLSVLSCYLPNHPKSQMLAGYPSAPAQQPPQKGVVPPGF